VEILDFLGPQGNISKSTLGHCNCGTLTSCQTGSHVIFYRKKYFTENLKIKHATNVDNKGLILRINTDAKKSRALLGLPEGLCSSPG
jgi:hypothetical protein